MKKKLILGCVATLVAGFVFSATAMTDEELAKLADAEYVNLVHPGGDGQEYWNRFANWFMYRPKICFPSVKGATNYHYTVLNDYHVPATFDGPDAETAIPEELWKKLPVGFFTVQCVGVRDGEAVLSDTRRFWKLDTFHPGTYPKAPRGYREAAVMVYEYLLDSPWCQTLVKTGKPDARMTFACYPSNMCGGFIHAMLRLAELKPARRADAMKLARAAADYLITIAEKPGAPLEYFTPTYATAPEYFTQAAIPFKGQTMLHYPAWTAHQFLELAKATGEAKYRTHALKVADVFVRTQLPNGTWNLRVWLKDGSAAEVSKWDGKTPIGQHLLFPVFVMHLMDRAFAATGEAKYRACADRAWRYCLDVPAKRFNWESQHEDIGLNPDVFQNLMPHHAADMVSLILERDPKNPALHALARDCMRFCEDQFVVWSSPTRDGRGIDSDGLSVGRSKYGIKYTDWTVFPAGLEQFGYMTPVDATSQRIIRGWLSLYRMTKNPLDLAKARALGDALVRFQRPNGRIQTELKHWSTDERPEGDWFDNMVDTAYTFEYLADFDE